MKKLKLNLLNLEGAAVLTRQQLKMVMGGSGEGGGGSDSDGLTCSTSWCGKKFEGSLTGSGKWVDYYCTTLPRIGNMPPSCGCEVASSVNCNA